MIVKVCGMREAENIRAIEEVGIDLMGFIFYARSKRNVTDVPDYLPERCKKVGVFVNAPIEEIVQRVRTFGLDYVQLHGNEPLDEVRSLRNRLDEGGQEGVRIIRAIAVASRQQAAEARVWEETADLLLFETPTSGYGGSGTSFDWSLLSAYEGNVPFLLAGGLGPESLDALLAFRHPRWVGIDLNSRFELEPGLKDAEKLKSFVENFRNDFLQV